MTDNGSCYKSFAFAAACKELTLKHIRTRPCTAKTNGKSAFRKSGVAVFVRMRSKLLN